MSTSQEQASREDPRIRHAGERTLLAWIRTGLALMGFGFVVARFGVFLRDMAMLRSLQQVDSSSTTSMWIGTLLVLLGVAVNMIAAISHWMFLQRIKHGQPFQAPKIPWAIVTALLVAAIGIGITFYLVRLEV